MVPPNQIDGGPKAGLPSATQLLRVAATGKLVGMYTSKLSQYCWPALKMLYGETNCERGLTVGVSGATFFNWRKK